MIAAIFGVPCAPARAVPLNQLAQTVPTASNIDVREFRVSNAQVPAAQGKISARQSITAWQVASGSWNGQSLDGLSLVLVQTISEDGRTARQTNCYISADATPAQRDALLGAMLASRPNMLSGNELLAMRVEPAVIRIEMGGPDGQTVILHLGLVA